MGSLARKDIVHRRSRSLLNRAFLGLHLTIAAGQLTSPLRTWFARAVGS